MSDDESGGDYNQSLDRMGTPILDTLIDIELGRTLGESALLLRPSAATSLGVLEYNDAKRRAKERNDEEERIKREQTNQTSPAFVTYKSTPEEIARNKELGKLIKRAAAVVCVLAAAGTLAYHYLTTPDYSVTDVAVGRKVRVKEGGAIGFAVGSSKQLKIPDGLVMTVVGLRSINDTAHSKYGIKKGATVIEADIGKDYFLLLTAASVEGTYPTAKIGRVDPLSPSAQKKLFEQEKIAQRKYTDKYNKSPELQRKRAAFLKRIYGNDR